MKLAEEPALTEADDGVAEIVKSSPLPDRVTFCCELDPALSVIVSTPEALPAVVGAKLTVIVQLALGCTEEPQLLVSEKGPLAVMEVIFNCALPELVSVRGCAELVLPTF